MPARCRHFVFACLVPAAFALVGCATLKKETKESVEGSAPAQTQEATEVEPTLVANSSAAPSVDLAFLLSMNFEEAKQLSGQSVEFGRGGRVTAEKIEVLKSDREGRAKKLHAQGKVYLEVGDGDAAKVLCQEAYVNGDEVVLRGRPVLQRGGSILEGLADDTVFYLIWTKLRVIGLHRITNPEALVAGMPDLGPWAAGPNPLLPALSESVVPFNIREEMLRAAEAELMLQRHRDELLQFPEEKPVQPITPTTDQPSKKEKPVEKENSEPSTSKKSKAES